MDPGNGANDSFYSTFSPDNGRDCLYVDGLEGNNPVEANPPQQQVVEPEINDGREGRLEQQEQVNNQDAEEDRVGLKQITFCVKFAPNINDSMCFNNYRSTKNILNL